MTTKIKREIEAHPPKTPIEVLPHELLDLCERYGFAGAAEEYDVPETTILRWLREYDPRDCDDPSTMSKEEKAEWMAGVYNPEPELAKWRMAVEIARAVNAEEVSSWYACTQRWNKERDVPVYKATLEEYVHAVYWLFYDDEIETARKEAA